jgi:hypothetical protein
LHEQDVNEQFFNVTVRLVVAAIETAPPFSLPVAVPVDTLTFSNETLCVELVDVDENTLDWLADPLIKETVDDFTLNEPPPPVALNRHPLTNVKLLNVHVVTVIPPVVERSKAEKPDEKEVRVVRVSVVLVNDIAPLKTETRENPRGVPVAVKRQFVIVREVPEEEINGETDVPIEAPNDNSIHITSSAPVFVIPAPAPLVSIPTERVAFEDVEFD